MTNTSPDARAWDPDTPRQQLEQQLQERLDILAELAPRALPGIDPVATQTAAANRSVIGQITAALNRLDAGTYGVCVRCGRDIPSAKCGPW